MATEHQHQVALFQWAEIYQRQVPELAMLVAIPNGGKRDKLTATNLKREGVKAGYPDIALNVARNGYHNLFIEMKVDGNYPTPKQKEWHKLLKEQGSKVVVCYCWVDAQEEILKYLKEK